MPAVRASDPTRPPPSLAGDGVLACCSALYGHPLAELLVGPSLHPGGTESTRDLLSSAGLRRAARLLDVGTGLGSSARMAAGEFGLRVHAVDASGAIVRRARQRSHALDIEWRQADVLDLPFARGTFDAVLAECVLSTTTRDGALAEIRRVLRRHGLMLMSDVQTDGGPIDGLVDHELLSSALCVRDAWTPGELDRMLPAHGLRLVRQWDRSDDILLLIDRIEARLAVAASMLPGLIRERVPSADPPLAIGLPATREVAASIRRAVKAGTLRYFAAVARPMPD